MADDHDDLLNFEIGDADFADGTLNEDELLLSDEENFDDAKDPEPAKKRPQSPELLRKRTLSPEPSTRKRPLSPEPAKKPSPSPEPSKKRSVSPPEEKLAEQEVPEEEPAACEENPEIKNDAESSVEQPPFALNPRAAPFRPQKFPPRGGWNNGMPRWQQQPGPFPNQRSSLRPPMMVPAPGRLPQMRPFPGGSQRAPFFMPQRPSGGPNGPPIRGPQRFFYQNPPAPVPPPAYVPTPIGGVPPSVPTAVAPVMPRKVLINPNFKGGVEAVKSQLIKEHFAHSSMSEDELLRKQQEFINRNMRSIEKRRHERSPSPNYRRSYSQSPSPPRNYRRRPFKNYERRRSAGDKDGKGKDENQPEEDEETRAYRQKIETQRKQREELLKQKEMRRKQQMEAKAKETEPLKPIVVTEKKIILTKKPRMEEKSTTPPISEAPGITSGGRRIILKSSAKEVKGSEGKIGISGSEKRKIQKIIKAE